MLTSLVGRMPGLAIFGLSNHAINGLINTAGYPIVGIFVAIESSGIPFPGETTLVLAAVYAGVPSNHFSIVGVILSAAAGAILGDNIGFTVGRLGGRPVLEKYGHYVRLKPHHLVQAEAFFRRHGPKTVFLGRFVAVLRAWAAFLAGVNRMAWPKFLVYNAAGGIVWATAYGILGYVLGNNLALLDRVLRVLGVGGVVIALLVVVISVIVIRRRRGANAAASGEPGPPDTSGGPGADS